MLSNKESIKIFNQTDLVIRIWVLRRSPPCCPKHSFLCFVLAVGDLKSLLTRLFVKSAENRRCLILPWASLWLCSLCAESAQIRPSTCLISWLCLCLLLLSGNPLWIYWGRPKLLRHPGHTLIPADLRPLYFPSWGWASHGGLDSQMLGDPAPSCASCCRRLWWWFLLSWVGGRPSVFLKTSREKRKLAVEIELTYPSWHLHTRSTPCSH